MACKTRGEGNHIETVRSADAQVESYQDAETLKLASEAVGCIVVHDILFPARECELLYMVETCCKQQGCRCELLAVTGLGDARSPSVRPDTGAEKDECSAWHLRSPHTVGWLRGRSQCLRLMAAIRIDFSAADRHGARIQMSCLCTMYIVQWAKVHRR